MSFSDIITSKHPAKTGLVIWTAGWILMLMLGHVIELETICSIAVLTAVLGAMTLHFIGTVVLATLSTLAINWIFIPPQGSFLIDLNNHATLLIGQWIVSIAVPGLIVLQRNYSAWLNTNLQRLAKIESELKLLYKNSHQLTIHSLHDFFSIISDDASSFRLIAETFEKSSPQEKYIFIGTPNFEVKVVMSIVCLQGSAFGPMTGNNENLDSWYFPVKREGKLIGVVHIPLKNHEHDLLLEKKFAAAQSALLFFDKYGHVD